MRLETTEATATPAGLVDPEVHARGEAEALWR